MRAGTERRLTIVGCMALTAALGAGLGLARLTSGGLLPSNNVRWTVMANSWSWSAAQSSSNPYWIILQGSWAVALPVTYTIPILRLLGVKPSRRHLFRPPGIAACLAVAVASCCMLLFWSNNVAMNDPWSNSSDIRFLGYVARYLINPQPLAASVAAVWIILFADRRWRPEPSWIDRTGRVLGIYWIAAGLAIPIFNLWQNWR